MTETMKPEMTQYRPSGYLAVPFKDISVTGIYVTPRGSMFRVPPEALAENHSPLISWETNESSLVTRISEDPYAPISKCRQIAADLDLAVNF